LQPSFVIVFDKRLICDAVSLQVEAVAKDHINPLCNGSPDAMQWQTIDAKARIG
jgi:hypothetical protein